MISTKIIVSIVVIALLSGCYSSQSQMIESQYHEDSKKVEAICEDTRDIATQRWCVEQEIRIENNHNKKLAEDKVKQGHSDVGIAIAGFSVIAAMTLVFAIIFSGHTSGNK